MTTSPPFPIERIELRDGPVEERFPGHRFERESLPVAVDEVFECEGGEGCLREHTRSVVGPTDEPIREEYVPLTDVRMFDKWDLQQCKECGGFSWRHAVIRDYL